MLSCSIWFSAPSFWMGGGRESRCVGRVCGADVAVQRTCFSLQPENYSSLTAPNLQSTTNEERNDQCGNEHYSRELLMMSIVVPETCSAYKKYNKIISSF